MLNGMGESAVIACSGGASARCWAASTFNLRTSSRTCSALTSLIEPIVIRINSSKLRAQKGTRRRMPDVLVFALIVCVWSGGSAEVYSPCGSITSTRAD
jgi:hypothetical protein